MPIPLILKKHKGFYSIPLYETLGVRALFTTRVWDMGFEGSRQAAYKALRIKGGDVVCPSQIHGTAVTVVGDEHRGRGAYHRRTAIQATDGLITAGKNILLAILTADCLPVFMFDPKRRVLGLVHAGWKGAHKRIIASAVRRMARVFSTEADDLIVVLGPSIRRCCYEVGREFSAYFPQSTYVKGRKLYFDLAQAVAGQLAASGVAEGRIHDSRLCTSCMDHEFFSYRKEGLQAGRSMSLIWMNSTRSGEF